MTLEDLGNIGELIGAVGVVLSLVYLAVQMRQNTSQRSHSTESARLAAFADERIAVLSRSEGAA